LLVAYSAGASGTALTVRASFALPETRLRASIFTYIYEKSRRKTLSEPNPIFNFLQFSILDLMSITVRPHGAGGKFFIFDSFNMRALIPKSPFDFMVRFFSKVVSLIVWVFAMGG